ncbi:hypothetical protein EPO44_02180 [bacterium]|nr:MAG: hypothetical protein EPO44_02180 [bacterium]
MSPESDIFDQIRLFLPKYLTPQETRDLYSELSKFPENKSFYLYNADLQKQMLQGDGWRGFIVIDFATGARKSVSGIILSNSCDISIDNVRDLPVNLLFAPLIEIQKYVLRLKTIGKTEHQIENIIRDIRKQRVTSIFYLPECQGIIQESIIALDDIHAHPLQDFISRKPTPLFTLNQYAFYLFLIKLSIHFSRFQEGISRFNDAA